MRFKKNKITKIKKKGEKIKNQQPEQKFCIEYHNREQGVENELSPARYQLYH